MNRTFLVCPFHRPVDAENVLANWRRQSSECGLVVVENGPALGTFPRDAGAVVLSSEAHQSAAKNRGLEFAAELGAEFWLTLDSDDWYGPDYVRESVDALERAALVGKAAPFWLTRSGREVWRADYPPGPGRVWDFLAGGTLGGRVSDGWRFRDTGPQGEDWDLVRRVVSAGGVCWSTASTGYLWRRDCGVHTCSATDVQLRECSRSGVTTWSVSSVGEAIALASGADSRAGEHRCSRGCWELGCPSGANFP